MSVYIFLAFALASPTHNFAISNVDVFDGYTLLRNQTVTVENGIVREILPAKGPSSGATLLPGLIERTSISVEKSLWSKPPLLE